MNSPVYPRMGATHTEEGARLLCTMESFTCSGLLEDCKDLPVGTFPLVEQLPIQSFTCLYGFQDTSKVRNLEEGVGGRCFQPRSIKNKKGKMM